MSAEIGITNATAVNGARLETGIPVGLRSDDELLVGVVALRFSAR